MLCMKCGISAAPDGSAYHTLCAPEGYEPPKVEDKPLFQRAHDPSGMSFLEVDVRDALTEIIQWGARRGRGEQVPVGPSEIGTPCDRELAYRIAGVKGVQNPDPLPAIIGTATHTWMQETMDEFEKVHGLKRFKTEMKVSPDVVIPSGTTDVYWQERALVLDWKFPGTDAMSKLRKEGFSNRYLVQLMLYGKGHLNAGRPVTHVGIVAMSRGGWLRDMWVKIVPYDESVAQAAIQRVYNLGNLVYEAGILDDSSQWSKIKATPSRNCGYCRMYRTGGDADGTGCPGR
jgi:hypothetical protein